MITKKIYTYYRKGSWWWYKGYFLFGFIPLCICRVEKSASPCPFKVR